MSKLSSKEFLMSFNVLICDDSALARKMMKKSLPTGFVENAYEVSNGVDALEVLAHHAIDLMLLDLTMPVLGGISVLGEIKRRGLETFVIVVSGDIQPLIHRKVASLGALDFVQKPLQPERLQAVLKKFGFVTTTEEALAG
jgi:two-component system chemotaxis response regulator CheY